MKFDGVVMGFSEDYSVDENRITLRNAVFPFGSLLMDWGKYNQANPKVREKHDLTLVFLLEGRFTWFEAEIVDTIILSQKAQPSEDYPLCMLVEQLTLESPEPIPSPLFPIELPKPAQEPKPTPNPAPAVLAAPAPDSATKP